MSHITYIISSVLYIHAGIITYNFPVGCTCCKKTLDVVCKANKVQVKSCICWFFPKRFGRDVFYNYCLPDFLALPWQEKRVGVGTKEKWKQGLFQPSISVTYLKKSMKNRTANVDIYPGKNQGYLPAYNWFFFLVIFWTQRPFRIDATKTFHWLMLPAKVNISLLSIYKAKYCLLLLVTNLKF